MHFFILALSCLLSFATASGVNVSAAVEPGFTWCDGASMTGRCVNAASAPNVCRNVIPSDSNKASSATANANSYCKLFDRYDCGTNGAIVEIRAPAPVNLSSLGFDNKMGSYRCNWINSPPVDVKCNVGVTDAETGVEYGYINGTLLFWGAYGAPQLTLANALVVELATATTDFTRFSLRALNLPGISSGSVYPFVAAMASPYRKSLGHGSSSYFPLGTTAETAGEAGMLNTDNSMTASFGGPPFWVETTIWTYDRITQVARPPLGRRRW
ncbi:hypothetical protein C8R47DRAFT_1202331 [Mycena vitilis]|nr:hypothetical protein C8R47DRAFT_1202331 [Mycena vitilis]